MAWMSEWQYLVPTSALVIILNVVAVIITLKGKQERRKSTTALMVSLLASDAIFGAVLMPVRIIEIWLAYSVVFPYLYAYVILVSAFNSFCLALDRYASVVKPLWRRLISTGTIKKGLLLTWACPLVFSLLPLAWTHHTGYHSIATLVYSYVLVGLLILVIVCIVVLQCLVMYGLFRYWATLKKDAVMRQSIRCRKKDSEFKQKLNSTLLCTCLIVTTVVTWLPTILFNFVEVPGLSKVSLYALMVNSLFDPLLVILFKSKEMLAGCCRVIKFRSLTTEANSYQSSNVAIHVELNDCSKNSL